MSLDSVLKKRKKRKDMETDNLRDFIFERTNQLIEEKFDKSFNKLTKGMEKKVMDRTNLILNTVKAGKDGKHGKRGFKGDKGDSPAKTFLINIIRSLIPKPLIGKQGDKGYKGDKGDSGRLDKPKEIVKKLNTLENVLDIKVLKGLNPILKSIQDSIRSSKKGGGGGGMGNPQHEQFALTSATTSVTLSYNVAASGFAIWVYYNGQAVSRNDTAGYSISGKNIPLGFTPQNGTYLDVIYIRS